jgi:cysteinyl-tRNA synthetase
MSLRIFNTLSRAVSDFSPAEPGHVRMYVCGMTVYDLCHLGHARSMVSFDVVAFNVRGWHDGGEASYLS